MKLFNEDTKVTEKLLKYYLPLNFNSIIKEMSIKKISAMYDLDVDESLFKYRFDYLDVDTMILIEFDGEQHFQPIDFFGGEDAFVERRCTDIIKQKFVVDYDFHLIRIREGTTFGELDKILNFYKSMLVDEKRHLLIAHNNHIVVKHDELVTEIPDAFKLKIEEPSQPEFKVKLTDQDLIESFFKEKSDQFSSIRYIASRMVYLLFCQYYTEKTNKKCKLKQRQFTSRIAQQMLDLGYEDIKEQRYFSTNSHSIDNMFTYLVKLAQTDNTRFDSRYYVKKSDYITLSTLRDVEARLIKREINELTVSQLSPKERICLNYLAISGNTLAMQVV